ncbi:MAG: RNase adaptor protein RapZ [Deltaproteobacteria bacterium GWC2_42_11]|nr:MAG: RNase adaptor protein RapZ [Deltaproteobacteria bacterium GWC2_42_11]
MKNTRLVILSGPSGAGKSTAIKVMEDMGFFCVDNLPVALLPKFLSLSSESKEIAKVAVVVDIREGEFLKDFPGIFKEIKKEGYTPELVYLEASDDMILKRFSETRRKHPLAESRSPADGIRMEREMLAGIKELADKIIDTSHYNVHQLKEVIRDYFSGPGHTEKITVHIISFSYRYGIPSDADLIMDVRFLPNPYFVDEFKGLNGTDERVRRFILEKAETKGFIDRFLKLMDYLLPLYWKEGKAYLTIAIGCTGGKHRSVAIVDFLYDIIENEKCIVKKRHRDIEKP